MNKEELLAENILLKEQVQQLTMQIEKLMNSNNLGHTETNLNWRELAGQVQNKSAETMIQRAYDQSQILIQLKRDQHLIGQEGPNRVKIEIWSEIHEAEFSACKSILQNESATHAICEVRERKRNATLGLLPTISELAELVSMIHDPEQQTLDANPPSFTQAEIKAKTPIR